MKSQRAWIAAVICALLANSAGVTVQGTSQEGKTTRSSSFIFVGQDQTAHPVEGGVWISQTGEGAVTSFSVTGPDLKLWASQDSPVGFSFISSEFSFDGRVVKGAPYSAEGVTETVQTLADGNRIVRRNTVKIYRDGEGRTRREQTLGAIGPWATDESYQMIFINDPVAGVSYTLDPRTKTATKMAAPFFGTAKASDVGKMQSEKMASTATSRLVRVSGGVLQGAAVHKVQPLYPPLAKAAGVQGAVQVQLTVNEKGEVEAAEVVSGHPLLGDASLAAARQWAFKPTELEGKPVKVQGIVTFNFTLARDNPAELTDAQSEKREKFVYFNQEVIRSGNIQVLAPSIPSQFMTDKAKRELLGKQVIEGVEAEGVRLTFTIPAGAIGNERDMQIVSEQWHSPELQIVVMSRHSDPRTGETTYRLTNITRGEPGQWLFEVPSDYTIKEGPIERDFRIIMGKPEAEDEKKKSRQP
jgi:TonB family protein